MKKSAGTSKYLFLAFVIIAAMVGYYFLTTKKKIEIPNILPSGKGIVSGIVFGDDKPSAVVNGVIVREGDVVNDIRVVRIYKDRVEFEKDGQRWRQRVKEKPPSIWDKAD